MNNLPRIAAGWMVCLAACTPASAHSLLVEAESFTNLGGWVVDQQFADVMGSPYLLAHGLGTPVADATTSVIFPALGTYRVWVRTKDWTAPRPEHAGSFRVVVAGTELPVVFGTEGQGWLWQDGGQIQVTSLSTLLRLRDLTGFEGRCDALFFTTDTNFVPPNSPAVLDDWRREQLGLPAVPPSAGSYDLVVVGGGVAGTAAAIAAARQGLKVALIHDRPWLGGNASQEIRVSTLGVTGNRIVPEINSISHPNGSDQAIADDLRRHQVVQNETNIHPFFEWRAFRVQTNEGRILSLDARHNRTGLERRFTAPLFIDSTGDGWIGYWAGATYRVGRESQLEFAESLAPPTPDNMRLGSSLLWNSRNTGTPVSFPPVPWATNVAKDYFATRGEWFWEYGLTADTIYDAEEIRDHLFKAIYGTWWNVKQSPTYANHEISWMGYVAGKRESRRLVGDYILSEADVRNPPGFPDAVVTEKRDIDLHYPEGGKYDFITYAQYTKINSYWIPFRCLYSTNIANLMMAGRCLSASHVGLGSPRVMNTCGQMGVATGTAAALCKRYNTLPRGVYQNHISELQAMLGITPPPPQPTNFVVILDNMATNQGVTVTGSWTLSTSDSGYYGTNYMHDGNTAKGAKSVRFTPNLPCRADYEVYLRWTQSSNRSTNTPVDIISLAGTNTVVVNQTIKGGQWNLLGTYPFALGSLGSVLLRTSGTSGYVIADAVAFVPAFTLDPQFSGDPWKDDDGDGICNYVEYLNGTDPGDAASFLKVELNVQSGVATLGFIAQGGRAYAIQYRDSLAGGSWLTLTNLPASDLTREVRLPDSSAMAHPSRFYRLSASSAP
ncbi:MAG TPA: FAD-dependent oxidoreductase [Candidatus Paceibacterota bacterium]|nr:FAD-dependent oxidoreductase [Candidatus Paceibacterota bacterium]